MLLGGTFQQRKILILFNHRHVHKVTVKYKQLDTINKNYVKLCLYFSFNSEKGMNNEYYFSRAN